MHIVMETLIISGMMLLLCSLPLLSSRVREHSKLFFLLGTGALAGLCVFDLLPDIFEMGGQRSLWLMGAVWLIYSVAHLFHIGHHDHAATHGHQQGEESTHTSENYFFLASMMAHCLASGMLLVVSEGLASEISKTVFFALLAHKSYEALTVSSILIDRQKSPKAAIFSILAYSLALPAGVLLTLIFKQYLTQGVAVIATSLAVGTLLGCLIFDFLIPSLAHLREKRQNWGWVILGLLVTQAVMRFV